MAVTILLGLCLAICMITDIIKRTVDIRVLILFFCMLMICGFIEKNISIHNITAGLFAAVLFQKEQSAWEMPCCIHVLCVLWAWKKLFTLFLCR